MSIETISDAKSISGAVEELRQARLWMAVFRRRIGALACLVRTAGDMEMTCIDFDRMAEDFIKDADHALLAFCEANYPRALSDEWPGAHLPYHEVIT